MAFPVRYHGGNHRIQVSELWGFYQEMKTFSQSRTCDECGYTDSRILSLQNAAFEERRQWKDPCVKCAGANFSSMASSLPDMNRELFETWIHDCDLTILSQDEDLVIGTGENLALLEEFLQRRDAAPGKREVILSAICVVLFDNVHDSNHASDSCNPEFALEAAAILERNMTAFDELNEDCISNYIKEVVYPVIGRSISTEIK